MTESPLCDLIPMAGNDKAWVWSANDFSEEEAAIEKFAARFQNVDAATQFKNAFEAAKAFNLKAKEEGVKDEDLVWADSVEDIDEPREDDIDTNKTAEGGDE